MKVLMIEPNKSPYEAEIGDTLEDKQKIVGGLIEVVYPYEDKVAIVCNEEAKLEDLPLNRALRDEEGQIYDIIAGTFFICGLGDEDLDSLSPELMEKYDKLFHDPEMFTRFNDTILSEKVSEQYLDTYNRLQNGQTVSDKTKVTVSAQPIISAFITNLGKYNEGELVGKWHNFPTTKEDIEQTFREIGIDGIRYEEFFITDYDSEIDGITKHLGEYSSIDEINYLASKIDDMMGSELEIYEASIESGEYCGSVKDLINLTENLDCYDYMEGVENDYDLGYYWVEESGCYDTKDMGNLKNYIDYEGFGRDIRLEESGTFAIRGYIRNNGDSFNEEYDGMDIPDEYKVFSIPKPKPRQQNNPNPKSKHDRDAR